MTNQERSTCTEEHVKLLENALTNLYKHFNDLVDNLNDNQKIISEAIKENLKEVAKVNDNEVENILKFTQDGQCINLVSFIQIMRS